MLVLLDVNGILTRKVPKGGSSITTTTYDFVPREGVNEFIRDLSSVCTVGIYSSTTYKNIKILLDALNIAIPIIMDRNCTLLDPDYAISTYDITSTRNVSIKATDTVKNLERLWSHPFLNADRKWNSSNTLLVEHDPVKTRFNDDKNVLIVQEYTEGCTETLADVLERIRSKIPL